MASYRVEVKSKETVAAALPLQDHWLPLSNLDLLLPPLDFSLFLCYPNSSAGSGFDATVASLKASLAKALVTYYPFAGEVVSNSAGEPEVLCNNRGVDFVVAEANVGLPDLDYHDPDNSVEGKLVPRKAAGVLSVQATSLRCGGFVLACTFDHRVADAYSADMFLVAWSEISVGRAPSVSPSFRRSLLSPRRPGQPEPSLDRLYVPRSSLKVKQVDNESPAMNRIYYVKAEDIAGIQEEASLQGCPRTKLEAFSAYLWKLTARAATKSSKYGVCRMGVVVNGRTRLPAMDSYFGNVLTIPYGEMEPCAVESMGLDEVAATVHRFVAEVATEEHFRGLVDWVEAHRPEPAATRVYFSEAGNEARFVMSSGRGFPVAEVEFAGAGRAAFGSYHFPWGGGCGYVMPMPSAKGNGDWVVYVHLAADLAEGAVAEAGGVLRPLTGAYVMGGEG